MKQAAILSAIVLASLAGDGMAVCGAVNGDQRQTESDIRTLLSGKRIFAIAPGGETWHEDHCSVSTGNGPANLYKVGAGTTVDPRALRGTWRINTVSTPPPQPTTTSTVKYSYNKMPPPGTLDYEWSIWKRKPGGITGGTAIYDFCDGSTPIAVITTSSAAGTPCP